jgi:peptidoglycan/xylan/chitin deacetylase (PgdA/CDA1 family)
LRRTRGGGANARLERVAVKTSVTTDRPPILMYHRVADSGTPALDRYRLTPAALEEQLRYLRDAGYVGVTVQAWHAAMTARRPLPGRAVLLTFDDGYLDFYTNAWPLLKKYGFPATVFLVADRIGGVGEWDAAYGEPAPLMDWPDILQLQGEGVEFGAHTCTHPPLTALSPERVTQEAARARSILTRGLGRPVSAFAYPYGDQDAVVRHLVGACGFTYGLTCEGRLSKLSDQLLSLPRLEITGADTLTTFVRKLLG